MLFKSSLLVGLSTAAVIPSNSEKALDPRSQVAWTWNEGAVIDYPIHVSCNATEQAQLKRAFSESITLAQHAKDHIMRFGKSSDIYIKYFGEKSATAEPAGWFDKVINSDKSGMLFRCDDVDNKCWQAGWAGHWRGEIAPDQTVICPLSFEARWPLEAMCGHGYTVAEGRDALYFGADILHRLHHTSKIGEGVVEHYADTQAEVLELAKNRPDQAVRNSVTLRHFAVEVYAFDIAVPGQGCAGTLPASENTPETTPTATVEAPATAANSAERECHTHADGVVHCA